MPQTINIPRETTMQDIAHSLQMIAFAQAGQAAKISTWDTISGIVRNGYAPKTFAFGDQFVENWKDTAANQNYEYPWRVNHFEDVELETGTIVPGMFLQAHYAHPFGVQFTNARAFLRCPQGLAEGTYNVTLGATWGKLGADANTTWQFTLTKPVPKGGRVAGFVTMPDANPSTWKAISYDADAITKIETVPITSGNAGTALGTMAFDKRTGDLNSMQETGYGWNRWKTSALRQYLNSDQPKGKWWKPQDEWDIAPNQLAEKDGFLCGMPSDMLKALKRVKVVTYANTVQDGGEKDITYDRVFLPSLEEIWANTQIAGEGTVHEYWKERTGSPTKLEWYKENPRMITHSVSNHASPQIVRLRSANRNGACATWYVTSAGSVDHDGAFGAFSFAPLVVV